MKIIFELDDENEARDILLLKKQCDELVRMQNEQTEKTETQKTKTYGFRLQ